MQIDGGWRHGASYTQIPPPLSRAVPLLDATPEHGTFMGGACDIDLYQRVIMYATYILLLF